MANGPTTRSPGRPTITHRVVTMVTLVLLFVGLRGQWSEVMLHRPAFAALLIACFGALLALAVVTLTARTRRCLTVVDIGLLLIALAKLVTYYRTHIRHDLIYPSDEGVLVDAAADALRHGQPIYGTDFTGALTTAHAGVTPLAGGGIANHYGYPPVNALVAAAIDPWTHAVPPAAAVSAIGLVAATVAVFLVVPAQFRSLGTLLLLGMQWFVAYAWSGYPIVTAMPFLIVAVAGWAKIGSGGHLGGFGMTRALFLGLAAATQQLAWFFIPFLVVGLFAVRRGELGLAATLRVLLRYLGLTALPFAIINAAFVVQDARAWANGILEPISQRAVPLGQGFIGISLYYTQGSGALQFYSWAAFALLLAFIVATSLFPRRLGPAITVLPSACFFLASRSQDNYYILLSPLWIIPLVTISPQVFARAWQPRPWLLGTRARRAVVAVVLALPAVACLTAAIATPPPLELTVTSFDTTTTRPERVTAIEVSVTNRSDHTIRPAFGVIHNHSMARYWSVVDGPGALAPGAHARFSLEPPGAGTEINTDGPTLLRAFSDQPFTLSSVELTRRPR